MRTGKRIPIVIAAATLMGGAIGLMVGHFHLPQTLAAAAIGVVIGMGVALGAFSLTPKRTRCN